MSELIADLSGEAVFTPMDRPVESHRWDRVVDFLVQGRKKWVGVAAGGACIALAFTEYQSGWGGAGLLSAGIVLATPAGLASGGPWGEWAVNRYEQARTQPVGEAAVQLAFDTVQ